MSGAPCPDSPGVYRVFIAHGGALAGTRLAELADGALLYVGKAEESLRGRDIGQHLATGRTGSSTLRRSLGAVLRGKLRLRAVPRGDDEKATTNYKFDECGEERLTRWMEDNLLLSWTCCRSKAEAKSMERQVIRESAPALNLTHNTSGRFVPVVEELRAECRREAGG
jgi:excinuclease UvrABC nuclease subunit